MAFWKKQTEEQPQTLSNLISGLQHSVNAAMTMLEARNLELLGRYFKEDGTPRTRRLNIDDNMAIDIPIISIVNPAAINIKEVEMDFAVQINAAELVSKVPQRGFMEGEATIDLKMPVERSDLEISFSGKGKNTSTMHVKIKFESAPVPEGIARIIEEYDKTIMPFNKQQ